MKTKQMMANPPKPAKKPVKLEKHGDIRIDNYYWLRDRENPEVLAYLKAENDYFDTQTAAYKPLENTLFEEMKARLKQEDESVPYFENGYFYQTKYLKGKEYPVYSRRKGHLEAPEEILFDVNQMAEKYSYYNLTGIDITPNNRYAVFGEDTTGRRQYILKIKDLITGEILPDQINNTTGSGVWANDNKTLFYTKKDPETLRAYQIYKHILGTPAEEDELVYEETDDIYDVFVTKSKSQQYIYIASFSTLTTEYRFIEADKPNSPFEVFAPRKRGVEYNLFHKGDTFYILTNKDEATNFKLMQTDLKHRDMGAWKEFIGHRPEVMLEDVEVFNDFMVLQERSDGLNRLRVLDKNQDYYIQFDEETYNVYLGYNPEMNTKQFRYIYNSMTTPSSVIEFDTNNQIKTVLKEQEIPDGKFNKDNYLSKRIWVTARDGKKVPVSMVWHRQTNLTEKNPLLLYGYGAYGITVDPGFSTTRLSLLDRGFIFAIAHVRGGEYLGRPWYEDGKLLKKKNTFNDFVDVAKHLITKGYTSPEQLYAMGGSAGGLLMGAVMNQAPEIFNGIVAQVPFVDVLTTMLDDSIPLTTGEYDEWGNPNNKTYYDYIKSYSPYDNIEAKDYPNLLVTTGLHDSQVQYWEPAKWVAKLREYKTDHNTVLLHTDMDSGHGGASGRFKSLKDTARDYAFIINLEQTKQ
jgi:oligopeptidase B